MKSFRPLPPLATLALCCLAVLPARALTNPPIRMAQGIEYMCGGRGGAEAAFMRTVAPRWAAALEFGISQARPGELPAEVRVQVRERYTGRPVMEAATAAPYLLARLEPGAYEIEATMGGVTLIQPLVVFNGLSARAAFVWPSNLAFSSATAADGRPRPEQQAVMRARAD